MSINRHISRHIKYNGRIENPFPEYSENLIDEIVNISIHDEEHTASDELLKLIVSKKETIGQENSLLERINLSNCIIKDSDLSDGDFTLFDFRDTQFINIDFTNANFVNSDLRGATFKDCKINGADLNGATISITPDLFAHDFSDVKLGNIYVENTEDGKLGLTILGYDKISGLHTINKAQKNSMIAEQFGSLSKHQKLSMLENPIINHLMDKNRREYYKNISPKDLSHEEDCRWNGPKI